MKSVDSGADHLIGVPPLSLTTALTAGMLLWGLSITICQVAPKLNGLKTTSLTFQDGLCWLGSAGRLGDTTGCQLGLLCPRALPSWAAKVACSFPWRLVLAVRWCLRGAHELYPWRKMGT